MKNAVRRNCDRCGWKQRRGSKRILGANGRLGEQVLTGRTVEEGRAKVAEIEKTLASRGIDYDR